LEGIVSDVDESSYLLSYKPNANGKVPVANEKFLKPLIKETKGTT